MMRLSIFHRVGIAIIAIIILIIFFWPTEDKTSNQITSSESKPIVIPPPNESLETPPNILPDTAQPAEEAQAPIIDDTNNVPPINEPNIIPIQPQSDTAKNKDKDKDKDNKNKQAERAPVNQGDTTAAVSGKWQNYQIQKGKTLAQLFRDNNLQANDAFAMARVEGGDKPLSNLQQGQKIRLQANNQGEVELLEITTPEGKHISFARLSDGGYYRTP